MATKVPPMLTDEQLASSPLIRHLLARVESLETQGVKQQEEIETLKAEMNQQRGDMRTLRSQLQTKNRIIQALYHRNSKSSEDGKLKNEELKQADSQIKPEPAVHGEESRQIHGDGNRIRRADNEVAVAFSASLTHNMLHVGNKQNIVFDHVITNVGNAYNAHHGIFIAPVSGVYVFATSVLSLTGNNNYAYISVNGTHQSLLYLQGDSHGFGSQTMVFQLNQGDDVSIHGHAGDTYYGRQLSYTTFAGFLLQQSYSSVGNIVG